MRAYYYILTFNNSSRGICVCTARECSQEELAKFYQAEIQALGCSAIRRCFQVSQSVASQYRNTQDNWRILGLDELWQKFGDVPIDPETECIEIDWDEFSAGTHREKIWHTIEETFGFPIYRLMYASTSLDGAKSENPSDGSDAEQLKAEVCFTMTLRKGESEQQALDRLFQALYDGVCNNAEHNIDFVIESQKFE